MAGAVCRSSWEKQFAGAGAVCRSSWEKQFAGAGAVGKSRLAGAVGRSSASPS